MKAYSVTTGLPGCLPNTGAVFKTLKEAREYAKDEKEQFIEDGWQADDPPGIRVLGNIRKDWAYDVYQYGSYGWHLWQRITIEEIEMDEDEFEHTQEHGW